ncbi:hypothetical protein CH286_25175 [Rhodococcus sp. WWJCD1]|uniref:hypothetical protein n=1 Tax=unclassified Rhodococcus (in: high G+C Gram-positive bacteria) TaxID=192944 RepID=UPI000B9A4701|nr:MULTISPECIES: hypothetical protein [unclassified Rhodococcus (in: high G+C Gram-positive bacteria)]OZC42465.1 hypothetical protein CH286_25175 [Rhodococcus sp. WWJCD1]OZE89309.1 hypothetical protein CH302_28430 [Rhodococcus sp. 15-2388-1-1a]
MDIASALADHDKALDLVTSEPTLDHLTRYEAAADTYTGFLNHRISLYFRVCTAGAVVLVALYFLLDLPSFPGIFVIWVWVLGIMTPTAWNMHQLHMVRKLVVSAHVFVDTYDSLRAED